MASLPSPEFLLHWKGSLSRRDDPLWLPSQRKPTWKVEREERPTFDLKLQVAQEFRHAEEAGKDGLSDPYESSSIFLHREVEHLAGLGLGYNRCSQELLDFFVFFFKILPLGHGRFIAAESGWSLIRPQSRSFHEPSMKKGLQSDAEAS